MTSLESYLALQAEPVPDWLANYQRGQSPDLIAFAQSRTVFYPGAGYDGQPVKLFGSTHSAHCFIYVDYGVTAEEIVTQLNDRREKFLGYQVIGSRHLLESDLTPNGWTPHLNMDEVGSRPRGLTSIRPFAFLDIFEREAEYDDSHGPRRIAILFLGADGIASYDALYSQAIWKSPFAVVVQDHGFGGNYTEFGHGGLLEKVAFKTRVFPEYLLVADNSAAWSTYGPVADVDTVYGGRGQIPHERRLFQRVAISHRNASNADGHSETKHSDKSAHVSAQSGSSMTGTRSDIFRTLYELAVQMLTADPNSTLGKLTRHHYWNNQPAACAVINAAILQRTMPGEAGDTHWGVLRVFMRNLVNRAQAPMKSGAMLQILNNIEAAHLNFDDRIGALRQTVSNNDRLRESLDALLDPTRAPDRTGDYINWLMQRIPHYATVPISQINANDVLNDVNALGTDQATKIPNMGVALAANLLADVGIRVVSKPDLHVLPTMRWILRNQSLSPANCIRSIIEIAKVEAPIIAGDPCFGWLTGGLCPRDLDRIIYLIGSDNFLLNGFKNQRDAPRRRKLMEQKFP